MFTIDAINGTHDEPYAKLSDMREAFDMARRSSHVQPLVVKNLTTGAEALFVNGLLTNVTTAHTHGTPTTPSNCFILNCGE